MQNKQREKQQLVNTPTPKKTLIISTILDTIVCRFSMVDNILYLRTSMRTLATPSVESPSRALDLLRCQQLMWYGSSFGAKDPIHCAFLKCWCCGLCYNHQQYEEHGCVEEPMSILTTSFEPSQSEMAWGRDVLWPVCRVVLNTGCSKQEGGTSGHKVRPTWCCFQLSHAFEVVSPLHNEGMWKQQLLLRQHLFVTSTNILPPTQQTN